MAQVVEMEQTEVITIRLPAKIRLYYEFENPYEYPDERQPRMKTEIELYVTKDEARTLNKMMIDLILEATKIAYNIRKIAQNTETTKTEPDADPA